MKESDLDNTDYQTFKCRLLTAVGFPSTGATLQLLGCPKPQGGAHIWSWTKHLYNHILEDATSRDNIIFKLVAAKAMTTVNKGCVKYLDCRDPQTETQFIDALQTSPATQRYRLTVFIATKASFPKANAMVPTLHEDWS